MTISHIPSAFALKIINILMKNDAISLWHLRLYPIAWSTIYAPMLPVDTKEHLKIHCGLVAKKDYRDLQP